MAKLNTHVAMAGDRNILPGMAVAGRSALENSSSPLIFEILGTGLTKRDKAKLISSWKHPLNAGVIFHEITLSDVSAYRSTMYLKSKSTYSRYYIGRIPNVDRLVYIDTDVVVLCDISETNEIDLYGHTIGAVRDISVRLQPNQSRMTDVLGLKKSADYFNSGFMIIDLTKWQKIDAEKKLCSISESMFDRLDCQDQDALNIVFEDDVRLLDNKWNTSQYEVDPNIDDAILHFIGTIKPWDADYKYHFKDLFDTWAKKTDFYQSRSGISKDIAAYITRLRRKIPTKDIAIQKIRRIINK